MGHYWDDYPEIARRQAQEFARTSSIKKKLRKISLKEFTVDELEPLLKVLGLAKNDPNEKDLATIEAKLKKLRL